MGKLTLLALLLVVGVAHSSNEVIVSVAQGKVRGEKITILGTTVAAYTGIPYAHPPVGELRFRKPQPQVKWEGIQDATHWDIACKQAPVANLTDKVFKYTEDCLVLNVWSPAKRTDPKSVAVWIHGGGFNYASSAFDVFNGSVLAATQDIVVASINYRLGILGFLDADVPEAPGNVGLFDQALALKWIQENIHAFGGDPKRVTIMGESAGSMSVNSHILSPVSEGLFQRAIMMSGTLYSMDYVDTTHESIIKGNAVARSVGCATDDKDLTSYPVEVLKCLRSKSAEELCLASSEIVSPRIFVFLPTFHNEFLPKRPISAMQRGFFQSVPVLTGVVTEEGSFSAIYPMVHEVLSEDLEDVDKETLKIALRRMVGSWMKYDVPEMVEYYEEAAYDDKQLLRRKNVERLGDREFYCPTTQFAKHYAARGNKVYSYVFGHRSQKSLYQKWMGVPHSSDIEYFLGLPQVYGERSTDEDKRMAKLTADMVGSFVKTGTPSFGDEVWPIFTEADPVAIQLQLENRNKVRNYRQEYCELWKNYF
ncbi:cholinesterase-like [Ornithodoros turicata]|uniref:cholinesterase-like n=1 Tax=Ornithodoros turicata TaxID=34597 RepID=UPI0031393E74